MAYVEENKVYNTVYGKLKNNNKMKQIQRANKALFQFSISEVTVDDGVLSVVCDAVTGETINYTLDLDDANAELTPELYNLSTGGSLQMFLALVWRLYTSTLDSTGEQVDSMSIEQLQDIIAELTKDNEDLTGQVETLTGQLEEAQSQTSSTGVQDYQKFTVNNTEYNIRILGNDTGRVFFMLYTDDIPVTRTLASIGFSSQQGAALFKNPTDNASIQFELYIDGTLQNNAGGVSASDYFLWLTPNPAVNFTADKPVCVKVMIKDSSDEVVSTAYDQFTYTTGGGVVDNRDTTTMQLMKTNLNGYTQIKCMVQNSTPHPISGTIDLYAGNTYLDTITLDNNNYVDYTPELESGTYTFTGYYYGSNEYKPCTTTISNIQI